MRRILALFKKKNKLEDKIDHLQMRINSIQSAMAERVHEDYEIKKNIDDLWNYVRALG